MSTPTNSNATLVGLLKEVYARKISEAWPEIAKLQERIKFDTSKSTGLAYNFPVDLAFEHGITHAAAGAVVRGAGYLPPSAGQMENGRTAGVQFNGRSSVSYQAVAASTAAGGREDQKKAFASATSTVVKRLEGSLAKRLEIQLLHGGRGLGRISANPATGATRAIVVSAATWSAGIFAGTSGAAGVGTWRGATLNFVDPSTGLVTTTGTTANGDPISVVSVDVPTRTVTVAVPNATDQSDNWNGLDIYWETARPATEMLGLHALGAVTAASGTVMNISAANYDLWQGNQYNAAGAISFSKLMQASALIANFGGSGDCTAVVSPGQFETINTDLAALRQFDVSYKKNRAESGVQSVTFYGQTGALEVLPHLYQKGGEAVLFMGENCSRIGSQDLEFVTGGANGPQLLFNDSDANAYEMRMFSEQALVSDKLRNICLITGITP